MISTRISKIIWVISFVFLMVLPDSQAQPGSADTKLIVKTILASHGKPFVDPHITGLVKELQSIFRYSSYGLLGDSRLNLKIGQEGMVVLPENRVLKIVPAKIKQSRIELRLKILKGKKQTFQTAIQLKNNGSITVGGPKHQTGVLLLNIYSEF